MVIGTGMLALAASAASSAFWAWEGALFAAARGTRCRAIGWRARPGRHVLADVVHLGLRGRCSQQVAHRVQSEFPSVQTLATLSPLPGFRSWLRRQLQGKPDAVHIPITVRPLHGMPACHMNSARSIMHRV